jgi:glucokinase
MNRTTPSLLRSINRSAVLDMIREKSPISRTQIANDLGISLPTVMRVVNDLIQENFVLTHGKNEATGGRPRSLLDFNPSAYAVVGIDLGSTQVLAVTTDLAGNIQDEMTIRRTSNSPEENLEQLCSIIEKLMEKARSQNQPIRGVAVAVPGVTSANEGKVIWAPSLGWRDVPLRDKLQQRFDLPIFIENDVNLAALGELAYGAGLKAQNLVCINIGTGIGAGIILGGELYRGHHQAAGEIGYLLPSVELFGKRYDEFGALEYYAAGLGMVRRAAQLLDQNGIPHSSDVRLEEVFKEARSGKDWAQQVVQETADYVGLAIAAVCALLDPEVIVLGGAVAPFADLLIDPILGSLHGVIPNVPRLVPSPLGQYAAVKGGCLLVLNATMARVLVKEFS